VTCSATDSSGTRVGTFGVHVAGAHEQIDDLMAKIVGLGPGSSLADKVAHIDANVDAGNLREACNDLTNSFPNAVSAQKGKKIPDSVADALIADAGRIASVLECGGSSTAPAAGFALLIPVALLGFASRRRLTDALFHRDA
jgi:hypothetical protein